MIIIIPTAMTINPITTAIINPICLTEAEATEADVAHGVKVIEKEAVSGTSSTIVTDTIDRTERKIPRNQKSKLIL